MTISNIETFRVDDIPLLLAIMAELGIQQEIEREIEPHGLWQGCSVGTIVVVWLCYILTEQDHRLEPVQSWVNSRQRLFNRLLGLELRETDFTDDRLANVLTMLSVEEKQELIAQRLSRDWITMYELPTEVSRYDSTTIAVYQAADEREESIIGYGQSKDHRPDLAQFKVMLSSLDMGLPLTSQVLNGKRADDGLYVPAYDQVVKTVGHSRFLAIGDSKMAAWETRCHLAVKGSWYLCPYREPASRGDDTKQWIEEALKEAEHWQAVTQTDEKTGEVTTIAQAYHWSRPQKWEGPDGAEVTWDERVLVTHSLALQQGLITRRERKEAKLYQALEKLRLPPSRGRKRYRTELELRQGVDQTLKQFGMTGLVNVTLTAEAHHDGGQRWIVADYQRHQAAWEAMVARLGWQIYLTNAPEQQYTVSQIIHTYRRQPLLERSISRLKSRNLHIRPVFLHDQGRISALTWLLVLALRILVLTEFRIRQELKLRHQSIIGLKPGSPTAATDRPTTERILKAFDGITWSIISFLDQTQHFHLTPLSQTQLHILDLLHLSTDIYLNLTFDQPKPLFNLRE
jgi:transposase